MTTSTRKSLNRALFVTLTLLFFQALQAQDNVADLMFTGFSADEGSGGGFSLVALDDISASTIFFSDRPWQGTGGSGAFNAGTNDGTLTWTVAATITKGTTITFSDLASGSTSAVDVGSVVGDLDLDTEDEVVYCYVGTANAPSLFITAIANEDFDDGSTVGELEDTGLTDETNAVSIAGDNDILVYTGSAVCNGTLTDCADQIATDTSWGTDDGPGSATDDPAAAGIDFPEDVQSFGGSLLPIELLSFRTQVTESNNVLVTWQTTSETNNDFFSIERSREGARWDVIAEIQGAGNSNALLSYRIVDETPLAGSSYYRMKQTDFDGQFSYSEVEAVSITDRAQWKIYPNPAITTITVEGVLGNELNIYNIQGQNVSSRVVLTPSGGSLGIDVRRLSDGVYVMQTSQGTRKIIKQQ